MTDEIEKEISNENKLASESSVDDILSESSSDVPPVVNSSIIDTGSSADRTPEPVISGVTVTPEKKRGRPKKNVDPHNNIKSTPRPILNGIPNSTPQSASDAAIEPCADILVMMTNASGMILAQSEAGAMTKEEVILARGGYVAYLKAKGVDNVPPWVILAGSLCPYYLRIITTTPAKTTVASGLRKAWFGIKEFFIKKKDAYTNRRDNIKRKNDGGEETGIENV